MKKIITILAIIAVALSMSACKGRTQTELVLKEGMDAVTLEYMSDELDMDPKAYLAEDTSQDVVEKVTARLVASAGEDGREEEIVDISSLDVGEYELVLEYAEEGFPEPSSARVKVLVVDTTAPVVEIDDDMEITEGTDLLSILKMDGDDYDIKVEGEVDYDVPGTYTIKWIISDHSGNITVIERQITVEEQKKPNKPSNPGGSGGSGGGGSGGGSGHDDPGSGGGGNPDNPSGGSTGCQITASPGNSGRWFDSMAEACAWADAYLAGANPEGWDGYGAGQQGGSCGKYTVNFYKSETVDPMDGWTEDCGILGC